MYVNQFESMWRILIAQEILEKRANGLLNPFKKWRMFWWLDQPMKTSVAYLNFLGQFKKGNEGEPLEDGC